MLGSIIQYFLENWPAITITAIIAVLLTWFVANVFHYLKDYKAHKRDSVDVKETLVKLDTTTQLIDKRTEHANCHVNTSKIEETSTILREVRDTVIAINASLTGKYSSGLNALAEKQSPLKLTALGNTILNESGGLKFIEAHKERIFKLMVDKNPQTAYDVQKEALTILLVLSEEPLFNHIKNYIYNAAAIKLDENNSYTVSLADVCYTMSIQLRDMYLAVHPEIDPHNYSNDPQ